MLNLIATYVYWIQEMFKKKKKKRKKKNIYMYIYTFLKSNMLKEN